MLWLLQTQQHSLEPLQLCRVVFFTSFPLIGLSLTPQQLTGTEPQPLAGFRYQNDPRIAGHRGASAIPQATRAPGYSDHPLFGSGHVARHTTVSQIRRSSRL